MTKFLYLLSAATIATVLAACTVTVTPITDTVDRTVSASVFTGVDLSAGGATDTVALGAGESIVYRVNVPSTGDEALYLYVNEALDLYVYRSSGTLYATSASADFFAGGSAGLAVNAAGEALSPSAVSANLACPGSCVILPSGAIDPVYVRVRNTTSTDQGVSFYATLRDFEDSSEATSGSDALPVNSTTTGALETLSDVDDYVVQGGNTLSFDGAVDSGILFEAKITDPFTSGSSPRYLRSGESASVSVGEEVSVYAVNDRAAVSGKSLYFLTLQ